MTCKNVAYYSLKLITHVQNPSLHARRSSASREVYQEVWASLKLLKTRSNMRVLVLVFHVKAPPYSTRVLISFDVYHVSASVAGANY